MGSMRNADVLVVLNAINTNIGTSGLLKLYAGTAPADVDTALSGNTLLATCALSATAFASAVDTAPGGSMTANAISNDTSIDATGTLTFGRLTTSAGTAIYQVSIGEITVGSTAFVAGAIASVTSCVLTMPEI